MYLKFSVDCAGMGYLFLSSPDSLVCAICNKIAKEAVQESCGKLFCSTCVDKSWKEDSCPSCKTPAAMYFVDNKSRGEINALAVWCDNKDNGCEWEGKVCTLEDHMKKCDFTLVPCPKQCVGDACQFTRKDLDHHLTDDCPKRIYCCEACGMSDTYQHITGAHDAECDSKMVDCTNEGCALRMERYRLKRHCKESCDYAMVDCKYASIGCKKKKHRKDIKRHEDNIEAHFTLAVNKIVELREGKLMNSLKDKPTGTNTYKSIGYNEKKKKDTCYYFKSFLTSPFGYKMRLIIYPNGNGPGKGTHLSVYLQTLHGPYDDGLEWPLKASFNVELLNQLADHKHCKVAIEFENDDGDCKRDGRGWGYAEFIEHSKLQHDAQKNTQYLKDDELYFRVTYNIPSHKPWLEHTHE